MATVSGESGVALVNAWIVDSSLGSCKTTQPISYQWSAVTSAIKFSMAITVEFLQSGMVERKLLILSSAALTPQPKPTGWGARLECGGLIPWISTCPNTFWNASRTDPTLISLSDATITLNSSLSKIISYHLIYAVTQKGIVSLEFGNT